MTSTAAPCGPALRRSGRSRGDEATCQVLSVASSHGPPALAWPGVDHRNRRPAHQFRSLPAREHRNSLCWAVGHVPCGGVITGPEVIRCRRRLNCEPLPTLGFSATGPLFSRRRQPGSRGKLTLVLSGFRIEESAMEPSERYRSPPTRREVRLGPPRHPPRGRVEGKPARISRSAYRICGQRLTREGLRAFLPWPTKDCRDGGPHGCPSRSVTSGRRVNVLSAGPGQVERRFVRSHPAVIESRRCAGIDGTVAQCRPGRGPDS